MKIRNWDRMIKEVGKWKENELKDDLKYLRRHDHGRVHFPLQKYQTHWLNKYTKVARDVNVNKVIVEACREIMLDWHDKLAGEHDKFYLATWLYPLQNRDSQIVVGVRERVEIYENLFVPVNHDITPNLRGALSRIERLTINSKQCSPQGDFLYELKLVE
ncbi:hypothetical protein [Neolewinella antarctica]|uniref:Uncharacterized protein n=1 Tax=Neolewinella antarctica TaxID=442734 RepID=A0ABX0XA94_9BACT|nr:hypothetical protein [Neolewinella antarctica]NJC25743.1 hypothetical protein [Neolewinella antarctica]